MLDLRSSLLVTFFISLLACFIICFCESEKNNVHVIDFSKQSRQLAGGGNISSNKTAQDEQ